VHKHFSVASGDLHQTVLSIVYCGTVCQSTPTYRYLCIWLMQVPTPQVSTPPIHLDYRTIPMLSKIIPNPMVLCYFGRSVTITTVPVIAAPICAELNFNIPDVRLKFTIPAAGSDILAVAIILFTTVSGTPSANNVKG